MNCPDCGAEMLVTNTGWRCTANLDHAPIPSGRDDMPQLDRGGIPTREQWREFREKCTNPDSD